MAQARDGQDQRTSQARKRKDAPNQANKQSNKRPRFAAAKDARVVAAQASSKAFSHGEVNVDQFVRSRQFEIQALEQGLVTSKKALTQRAFQLVPKELRRRTASHNAKRVPKRLRDRAKHEMKEDHTPTVTARRRKPTSRMRLRNETAKALRALSAGRQKHVAEETTLQPVNTRAAKIKSAKLAVPPLPKAKFKKRQIDKTWLPTHLYHAKRARMTPPKEPLWRFAVPLTPTAKSYRATHRAANERGSVAFDMSYISTIALTGRYHSLLGILHVLDLEETISKLRTQRKWSFLRGESTMDLRFYHREQPHALIAPTTVIWKTTSEACSASSLSELENLQTSMFIRVHPSAFLEIWDELVRISKTVKPGVTVVDLRYEIGSIDVVGPASTESLVAVMDTYDAALQPGLGQLRGLNNTSLLPKGTIIDTEVRDPRLCTKSRLSSTTSGTSTSASGFAEWTTPLSSRGAFLFDKRIRVVASSSLPSQKAVNRRRESAGPGQDPMPSDRDPRIPVLAFTSCVGVSKWTLLLPWKCVLPMWYAIMYLPLSTGVQPRLGGLTEIQELSLEHGRSWFPADFPNTKAGWAWELAERQRLHKEWSKRPKSRRVNWETLDLGDAGKGELGRGWACEWGLLVSKNVVVSATDVGASVHNDAAAATDALTQNMRPDEAQETRPNLSSYYVSRETISNTVSLCQVQIEQITRGVSFQCARIYRLPRSEHSRAQWLDTHPKHAKAPRNAKKMTRPPIPSTSYQTQHLLAQSLLAAPQPGQADWPSCPGEDDLIGFVTSGNYDLCAGKGTAIGSILSSATLDEQPESLRGLCIVRNSGQTIGRLARWRLI